MRESTGMCFYFEKRQIVRPRFTQQTAYLVCREKIQRRRNAQIKYLRCTDDTIHKKRWNAWNVTKTVIGGEQLNARSHR